MVFDAKVKNWDKYVATCTIFCSVKRKLAIGHGERALVVDIHCGSFYISHRDLWHVSKVSHFHEWCGMSTSEPGLLVVLFQTLRVGLQFQKAGTDSAGHPSEWCIM